MCQPFSECIIIQISFKIISNVEYHLFYSNHEYNARVKRGFTLATTLLTFCLYVYKQRNDQCYQHQKYTKLIIHCSFPIILLISSPLQTNSSCSATTAITRSNMIRIISITFDPETGFALISNKSNSSSSTVSS